MTRWFTRDHEWIEVTDGEGTVGITDYAQRQLGDVVFVELPNIGARFAQGAQAAVVESVKAASEVYAPVSGEVIAINTALDEAPNLVNDSALAEGWFFKLRLDNAAEIEALLGEVAYRQHVESLA